MCNTLFGLQKRSVVIKKNSIRENYSNKKKGMNPKVANSFADFRMYYNTFCLMYNTYTFVLSILLYFYL